MVVVTAVTSAGMFHVVSGWEGTLTKMRRKAGCTLFGARGSGKAGAMEW